MDETSVAFAYVGVKGTVLTPRTATQFNSVNAENIPIGDSRGHVTWCCFVSSIFAVQALLPQVIISSKRNFSQRLYAFACQNKRDNVHIWVEESGWVSQALFDRLLRVLHRSLSSVRHLYQLILVVDVARCHICLDIARRAHMLNIILVFIPAKLTWLLQPLDTHVFAMVKRYLKNALTAARAEADHGRLNNEQWLCVVLATIDFFLQHDFSSAFVKNGLAGTQLWLRDNITLLLEGQDAVCGFVLPSLSDLEFLMALQPAPYYDFLLAPLDDQLRMEAEDRALHLPALRNIVLIVPPLQPAAQADLM